MINISTIVFEFNLFCSIDIDTIISQDIFKAENDDARRQAMMGLIDLK